MVVRVSAKTMPGKALSVERELRWRIKRAFDAADIRIVGGLPAQPDDETGRRPDGGHVGPVRLRLLHVPAVPGGFTAGAAERDEVGGSTRRTGPPQAPSSSNRAARPTSWAAPSLLPGARFRRRTPGNDFVADPRPVLTPPHRRPTFLPPNRKPS